MSSLRLAIYFENRLGRNDGNPLYVWAALKRMQEKNLVEIDHLIPTGNLSLFGHYDFHLDIDYGQDALTGILPYTPLPLPSPKLGWMSDTHLDNGWRIERMKDYDLAFFAQKDAVDEFNRLNPDRPHPAIWLPHAVEPLAYPRLEIPGKKYDVCFVGHVNSPNRVDALDRLFREFPNFYYGQALFEEAAEKYCESKIVFNIAMKDDINMRNFEVMATGSFLLTDRISTIEDLFVDGVHCVMYDSLDDMVEKAKYYLAHDEERERIAQQGYSEVMRNHTIDNRVNRMLEEIKKFQLARV